MKRGKSSALVAARAQLAHCIAVFRHDVEHKAHRPNEGGGSLLATTVGASRAAVLMRARGDGVGPSQCLASGMGFSPGTEKAPPSTIEV